MSETTKQPSAAPLRDNSRLAALLILLLTAAIALAWSHTKLLSQDEIFVLQTDTVSSVRELLQIQRHYPISLDPLVFHLLAHACTKLLGPTALALRLPSIAGFLLMQLCIFLATRRLANARAALIAMAFPAFTASLFYAPEARPYGLLLGLYALAFLAWQAATRALHPARTTAAISTAVPDQTNTTVISTGARSQTFRRHPERTLSEQRESKGESKDPRIPPAPPRTLALTTLALAIALTLNTHYFGILILIPLCLAELARTLLRRRLDPPMLAAILLGMAGILFALPFQKAAGEFREHYYNAGVISVRAITQAYRSLFVNYTTQPLAIQRLEDILLVLFAIAVIVLCIRRLRPLALPRPELVFLLALAALPLFGVALAVFVTHSIEVRYVLSAIIAIGIFFAIAVEPSLRTRLSTTTLTALLLLGILLAGLLRIRDEHAKTQQQLALLTIPPALKSQLLSQPDQHIYIQDMGHFEVASYYEPDPDIRSRLTLLYSHPDELRYDLHDTASLTAEHMQHFTGFTIVPYPQLKAASYAQTGCQPDKGTSAGIPHESRAEGASAPCNGGNHILILYHSGWDWTDQALAADSAHITSLGPALDGDAVTASFSR